MVADRGRQLYLLHGLERLPLRPLDRAHRDCVWLCDRDRTVGHGAASSGYSDDGHLCRARSAVYFSLYHQGATGTVNDLAAFLGWNTAALLLACQPDPAGRDLVPHVPDDWVPGRCPCRSSARGTALREVRRVCRLFSAARGRPDRAVVSHAAAVLAADPVGVRARSRRPAPRLSRSVEKGLRRRFCLAIYRRQAMGAASRNFERVVLVDRDGFLSVQIYRDFLGYTDMAKLGIAKILGTT